MHVEYEKGTHPNVEDKSMKLWFYVFCIQLESTKGVGTWR
jgi:hypothetical protein